MSNMTKSVISLSAERENVIESVDYYYTRLNYIKILLPLIQRCSPSYYSQFCYYNIT